MWKYEPFKRFLRIVASHPTVDEILIIDNEPVSRPEEELLDISKLRFITAEDNSNMFVNPAWNIGVKEAKNEYICIMNDDVIFDTAIFYEILPYMIEANFGAAGAHPGNEELFQQPFINGLIDIKEWESPPPGRSHGYLFGFGTLFFVNKSKWFPIPTSLKLYYGDDWVHLTQDTYDRKIYLITNFFYHSPSAQTCTKLLTEYERNQILEIEGESYRQEIAIFRDAAYQGYIEGEFDIACTVKTDINEHIPILRQLASECERVVELGVREGWSTRAFLTQRNKLRSYDIIMWPYVQHLFNTMKNVGRDFDYIHANSLHITLDECDMIFFDTEHTYKQLKAELELHGNKATKYLVFHDTVSYQHELMPAIQEFMEDNKHWKIKEHYTNNNGLLVLERSHET